MPVYTYKGYDAVSGVAKKGKVEADSPKGARAKLRKNDRVIVSELKEQSTNSATGHVKLPMFGSGRVSTSELAIMTRQFATLQGAHVPLDECLKALVAQVENRTLQGTLSGVKDKVSEGVSLGDAMASYSNVFNRLYVNMVRAGESSGKLSLVFERLADFLENQDEMKAKVMGAMTYPAVMIVASTGVIGFLFVSIVPQLVKVFDSLKVTLPWYTKLCIWFSDLLQHQWWLIAIILGGGYFFFNRWIATSEGRATFDRKILHMPVFGPIILRMMISRFTRTLETLLSSGVPIIQALDITKNVITNTKIAAVIEASKIAVQEGDSLGKTIARSEDFPPLVTQMIQTGERTGQLEEMLGHVAKAYDTEVDRKLQAMISLIEPGMIIMMGGVGALVVFSLIIPMLSVMNQLR